MPQVDAFAGAIAPYARGLEANTARYIRTLTYGTAPERKFVVEYNGINDLEGGNGKTFEVILSEGTNTIRFQYLLASNAPVAFGIESPDQTMGMGDGGSGSLFIRRGQGSYAIEFTAAVIGSRVRRYQEQWPRSEPRRARPARLLPHCRRELHRRAKHPEMIQSVVPVSFSVDVDSATPNVNRVWFRPDMVSAQSPQPVHPITRSRTICRRMSREAGDLRRERTAGQGVGERDAGCRPLRCGMAMMTAARPWRRCLLLPLVAGQFDADTEDGVSRT